MKEKLFTASCNLLGHPVTCVGAVSVGKPITHEAILYKWAKSVGVQFPMRLIAPLFN